jgi:hypothetical protein
MRPPFQASQTRDARRLFRIRYRLSSAAAKKRWKSWINAAA